MAKAVSRFQVVGQLRAKRRGVVQHRVGSAAPGGHQRRGSKAKASEAAAAAAAAAGPEAELPGTVSTKPEQSSLAARRSESPVKRGGQGTGSSANLTRDV